MLSVIVLTKNEARHIKACLDSIRGFADELLVFDSHSDDATLELAKEAGARVCQRPFDNYPNQRNAALAVAQYNWVFFIDADERADSAVGGEIRAVIARAEADPNGPVLYWIPRKNYIFGRWIRYAGWSPDYQPRLMRRDRVHFDPTRPVHELVMADGPEAYLENRLTHLNYETLAQFRKKQIAYTRFEAEEFYREGRKPHWWGYIGQPLREFLRRYVALQGYKDGRHGLLLCMLMGYYAFVRHRMLMSMQK